MVIAVTLHLFGTSSILLHLESIDYVALEAAVIREHPGHLDTLPSFAEQCLNLSYKQRNVLKHVLIQPRTVDGAFPKPVKTWTEVSLSFVMVVTVYKAGKEMVAKKNNQLFSLEYFSNGTIDSFANRCDIFFQPFVNARTTIFDACCDKDSIMFSAHHLLNPIQSHKNFFVVQNQSSYSHATIAQLLTKVDFPEVVMNRVKEQGKKRKLNEETKFLDAFADSLPKETPLQVAVKLARVELTSEWQSHVQACVQNLALLNRHVASAYIHSESARRLLINEVIKQVIAYTGGTFCVEELQNSSASTEEKFLGWGPVDFTISTDVVVDVLSDENENEAAGEPTESRSAANRSVRTPADELYEEDPEGVSGEEAKVMLDDGGLAQGGSQIHDRLMDNPGTDRVALILCTGHKWLHFVLQRGAGGADVKPVLHYFGEASMRILRSTVARADALRRKNRRLPSCRYSDEFEVEADEIENVMLSLLCSIQRKLGTTPVGAALAQSSGSKEPAETAGVSSASRTEVGTGALGMH